MDPVEVKPLIEVPAETLPTLVELGEEINASLDLDEVLQKAAALIHRLIDYEVFAVMLYDDRRNDLYFRFAVGHNPEVVKNWRVPIGQGITGTAAATGLPIRVSDVSTDPRYINALDSVRSELAVPLNLKGRCIGVLDIQSSQPDYFTRDQQNILTLVASRLAIAIENARLFEHAISQAETLLLLNEVGREASSILSVEELLRRAAELVKRVIDYQIFSILLLDDRTQLFQRRIVVKYGERLQEKFSIATGEGIIGAAAHLGRPVLVPDVSADPRYVSINPETRSELAIPLMYQNKVLGVMDLESPQLNYFTNSHVQALSILAAQLAVSLENARLYEQVARDEARLERDLLAARRLQGALLPQPPSEGYDLEIATRYDSAREVGGDLYDFLRYGPQQLALVLGDVSGKGTAAALYAAVVIGILRSLTPQKPPPAEALRQLNELLCERRIEGRFTTMILATWQKKSRRLTVANAGQSQPLLFHQGRTEKLKVEGFPLGLYDAVLYEEWTAKLDPGDILVFYSDGLAESMNRQHEQYGAERLASLITQNAALSATELADKILQETESFAEGQPAHDDRTLVIAKVKQV